MPASATPQQSQPWPSHVPPTRRCQRGRTRHGRRIHQRVPVPPDSAVVGATRPSRILGPLRLTYLARQVDDSGRSCNESRHFREASGSKHSPRRRGPWRPSESPRSWPRTRTPPSSSRGKCCARRLGTSCCLNSSCCKRIGVGRRTRRRCSPGALFQQLGCAVCTTARRARSHRRRFETDGLTAQNLRRLAHGPRAGTLPLPAPRPHPTVHRRPLRLMISTSMRRGWCRTAGIPI